MSYSKFMYGLKKSGITLNRKVLADIAVHDAAAFKSLAVPRRKPSRSNVYGAVSAPVFRMKEITSKDNAIFRHALGLKDKRGRDAAGEYLAEGERLVLDLFQYGFFGRYTVHSDRKADI